MLPIADKKWKGIYEIESYETYLEKMGKPVELLACVDEHVRGIFRLVNRLVALAYYEYEFWDLASMKSLLALELAVKQRYAELNPAESGKQMILKKRLAWFRERGYFEIDSEAYLDQIRYIRNHFAHPDYHSFAGPVVSWHIFAAANLINDLYESRELRLDRKKETGELNEKLAGFHRSGMLLQIGEASPILVYRFVAGFINNKLPVKTYHFAYRPAFVLPKEYKKGDSIRVYDAHTISCTHYTIDDQQVLTGFDLEGRKVFSLKVPYGKVIDQWREWNDAYEQYINVFPHFVLNDNRSIGERAGQAKWEFHQV